jgi:hypothetical protein
MHCTVDDLHAPILMEPSDEDFYEGPKVLKYACEKVNEPQLRRDCPIIVKNAMSVIYIKNLSWLFITCNLDLVLQACVKIELHVLNF